MRKILGGHGLSSKELAELGVTLDRLRASRSRLLEAFEIEDATARLGLTRQWLHAYELAFTHPATGERESRKFFKIPF